MEPRRSRCRSGSRPDRGRRAGVPVRLPSLSSSTPSTTARRPPSTMLRSSSGVFATAMKSEWSVTSFLISSICRSEEAMSSVTPLMGPPPPSSSGQRAVVVGEGDHDALAVLPRPPDPVDPHLLVRDVVPVRPVGERREPVRAGGRRVRAVGRLDRLDQQVPRRLPHCDWKLIAAGGPVLRQRFGDAGGAVVETAHRVARHLDGRHERAHGRSAVEQLAAEREVRHRVRVQVDPALQPRVGSPRLR